MTSWYSVIQYVPDPIAGELINIGLLVSDEQEVQVHFLQNWERVRCFGMSEDIDIDLRVRRRGFCSLAIIPVTFPPMNDW
jgi:hypothetical protein